MPTPLPNYTVHKCDYCGKKHFRKGDATRHEKYCSQNPANNHLCFQMCKNLVQGKEEYEGCKDEIKFTGTRTTFTCQLTGQKMYSYIAERKRHPVVTEPDTIRMPLECDKYESKTDSDYIGGELMEWQDIL